MEAKEETPWSSILVPSVQEMVKDKMITTVPPRYVRYDQDKTEVVVHDSGLISEIPIIDMNRLCSSTAVDSEVEKLDFACKEYGFFQAKSQTSLFYKIIYVRPNVELITLVSMQVSELNRLRLMKLFRKNRFLQLC